MISFKMFAGTNVGLRENNEDNFTVCPDLTKGVWIVPDNQQVVQLGARGCLVVVADGMGGQNAGEVASALAIETVQQMFAPNVLATEALENSEARIAYLKKVIIEADIRVKAYGVVCREAAGLGSTIVMAWLLGNSAIVAWLGDSRAYSYVPGKGIARLSKDHSYVQQLVEAGKLTDLEAMHHPNSNIITRSLGDNSQKAKPDAVEHFVSNGEVLLLCSDGLCGVCTDEQIANIVESCANDLLACKETLTQAALGAGGSDNITVALLQVRMDDAAAANAVAAQKQASKKKVQKKRMKILLACFACVMVLVLSLVGFFVLREPEVEWGIKLKIDGFEEPLSKDAKLTYHVDVIPEGQSEYVIKCNPDILDVDSAKQQISIKSKYEPQKDDSVTIVAICQKDTSVCDTVRIKLKYNQRPTLPSLEEMEEIRQYVKVLKVNPQSGETVVQEGTDITSGGGTTKQNEDPDQPTPNGGKKSETTLNPKDTIPKDTTIKGSTP